MSAGKRGQGQGKREQAQLPAPLIRNQSVVSKIRNRHPSEFEHARFDHHGPQGLGRVRISCDLQVANLPVSGQDAYRYPRQGGRMDHLEHLTLTQGNLSRPRAGPDLRPSPITGFVEPGQHDLGTCHIGYEVASAPAGTSAHQRCRRNLKAYDVNERGRLGEPIGGRDLCGRSQTSHLGRVDDYPADLVVTLLDDRSSQIGVQELLQHSSHIEIS